MRITEDMVLFWTARDYMSNFYQGKGSKFTYKGHPFSCSEQAFMWEKANTFNATNIAKKLLTETNPNEAKKLGRAIRNYDDAKWSKLRFNVMVEVLKAKFNSGHLHNQLMDTGKKQLVEASPIDNIWGIGLGENDEKALDQSKWRGQNLLGIALMDVRDYYLEREMEEGETNE